MKPLSIGDVHVSRVVELAGSMGHVSALVPEALEAEIAPHLEWLAPRFMTGDYEIFASIHAYVIRTPRHTILVDTCAGNDKERPDFPQFHQLDKPFLKDLKALGVAPEEVDFVLCTHLHVDHVGWNTRLLDGRWVPTFPNARYIFARRELAHWEADAKRSDSAEAPVYQDSVLPVIEAGQALVVESDHQIDDTLWLEPWEGHTPGHVCLHAKDGGRHALFSGDVMHHPVQIPFPEWNSAFCVDKEASAACRRRFVETWADTDTLVVPAHFAPPTYGRIESWGDTFRFRG